LGKLVESGKSVEVALFISNTDHPSFALDNAMDEGAITWKDALEIAVDKIGGKVSKAKSYEVYIKIINDMAKDTGAFWYVQFITDDGNTHFCVIAPDGSVIG
ncbi:MAG: hypothetical protein FWF84_06130, partial [Kiritimatiellaeota bacterium]|nr:hypothetical protein [Kiritimatiellota bacterium]